jgi:hypothetical protein
MANMQSESAPEVPESQSSESAGLRWTGHPLADHGIATLVAFTDLERGGVHVPEDVTKSDLESIARSLERALKAESVRSHASVLFTINVPYLQPSHSEEKKAANARWLFRLQDVASKVGEEFCPYSGLRAP